MPSIADSVTSRLPFPIVLTFAGNIDIPAAEVPITLRHSMQQTALANTVNTALSLGGAASSAVTNIAIGSLNLADAQLNGLKSVTYQTPVLVEYTEAILMRTLGYTNVFYPVFESYTTDLDNTTVRKVTQIIKVDGMPPLP